MYDIETIRQDFPILARTVYNRPLVYLDNAATTQKPKQVVRTIEREYFNENANVHRGVHYLSQKATELYEEGRTAVARFINAEKRENVVFTRGTTESINLVAHSFSEAFLTEGDEVIVSQMEHHSNIVPWQLEAKKRGFTIKVIPVDDSGELDMEAYARLLSKRTKLVAVCHVSNVLGTVNPVEQMARMAHQAGARILVDGAQSAPHMAIDVQAMGCDFFAFSGHKMYGPTGIGALYGKEDLLRAMPPYQGGGEMIRRVSFSGTTFEDAPLKFEAGTPDYIAATALKSAIDYIGVLGMDNIAAHERDLTNYAMERLLEIPKMRIFGTAKRKDAVVSFLLGDIHPQDMGILLDRLGLAVRTGHHCAEPLMERFGIQGTVRASFALYNTRSEVDALAEAIERVAQMF